MEGVLIWKAWVKHAGAKFGGVKRTKIAAYLLPNLLYVVRVARLPPVLDPPPHLLDLYTSLCNNIRAYNRLLACSSFGANIDENFQGQGVPLMC